MLSASDQQYFDGEDIMMALWVACVFATSGTLQAQVTLLL